MWTFSLYLEAVAILPQLVLLQRTRNIDNLTGQYVFLLGYVCIALCIFMYIFYIEEYIILFSARQVTYPHMKKV